MTALATLDVELLKRWIGRTEAVQDVVSSRLANEFHATLDYAGDAPISGEPAPLAIHWCLAPPAAHTAALGPDGHPARGGFLPPVPLPRRMWAGSTLRWEHHLHVGDMIERRSRIADVSVKEGRSGVLCFVGVDHETWTNRGLAIAERQNIVYRPAEVHAAKPVATMPAALSLPGDAVRWHRDMAANATLLFRYSALTFNGHRIHYDRNYAIEVENYPGLVVHGPLQATQLLDFAIEIRGDAPRSFSFRGLSPLFDGMPYRLCARDDASGLKLWIEIADGGRTTEAEAAW